MTKFTTIAYPAIAMLSLAAAFGAHAQSVSDDADRAGYGPSYRVAAPAIGRAVAQPKANEIVIVGAKEVRSAKADDFADRGGYGATLVTTVSTLTRAEVLADAIAAREAGWEVFTREGGDAQYTVVTHPSMKAAAAPVLAAVQAPAVR